MLLGRRINLRTLVLGLGLSAVTAVWAVNYVLQWRLEVSVEPLVKEHDAENRAPNTEVRSIMTVTREDFLWGRPRAKVEVFVRPKDPDAEDQIAGIEYYYVRQGGQWRLTDSGACSGPECALRGQKLFAP